MRLRLAKDVHLGAQDRRVKARREAMLAGISQGVCCDAVKVQDGGWGALSLFDIDMTAGL